MTKQEQKDKAYAEYNAIIQQAYKKYRAIQGPAYKKYRAIEEAALKEYQAIEKQSYKEYQAKCNEIDEQDIKIIDGKKYKLVD